MRVCDEVKFNIGERVVAAKHWRGGARPTLALHGWLDNANSFDALARAMPELDLVAMDFAGHGYSDPRPSDVGYWGWLDIGDVIAVADQLGWDQFAIIAHSMGAEYSTQLVGLYPERVTAQVCIDGYVEAASLDTVLDAVRENLDTCLQLADASSSRRYYGSLDAMAARLQSAKEIDRDAALALLERGHVQTPDGFTWSTETRIRRTHTQRQPDDVVMALARRTRAPTLLIRASAGETWFLHSLDLIRDLLPDFQEVTLSGPHHLHMSAALPEVVARIRHFLAP